MESRKIVQNIVDNGSVNHPNQVDWREIICRISRMFGYTNDQILDMKIRVLYAYWEWCVYFTQEDALSLQMRMF